jgi:hypothetical protein
MSNLPFHSLISATQAVGVYARSNDTSRALERAIFRRAPMLRLCGVWVGARGEAGCSMVGPNGAGINGDPEVYLTAGSSEELLKKVDEEISQWCKYVED